MYAIAVLRSRTQTYSFMQILVSYNIKASVIQTPRQAAVSCGVSVKMPVESVSVAKQILSRRGFSSFVGFFLVEESGNGISKVRPI